jgi:esterase/lipase superfamily enzyme
MFAALKAAMQQRSDVLVYAHGFNVARNEGGAAPALQDMLNHAGRGDTAQSMLVVLFTWPSDGMALPLVSYKSARTERLAQATRSDAACSNCATTSPHWATSRAGGPASGRHCAARICSCWRI